MATKNPSIQAAGQSGPDWQLRLYIAGQTPRSARALRNLYALCEQHLQGQYAIEVIDLKLNPTLAADHQILAVPTLIRRLPESIRMVIGDLSDTERVLVGLDIVVARKPH